jgi:hypothetical protein
VAVARAQHVKVAHQPGQVFEAQGQPVAVRLWLRQVAVPQAHSATMWLLLTQLVVPHLRYPALLL